MTKQLARAFGVLASFAVALSGSANANTITQNTSWKITRTNATTTYQVVAYGDSIYAGYNGGLWSVLRRAGPWVDGEYLGKQWNANIQVVRRTKSGAKADDIYNNKIIAERSYMQNTSTRVVEFEMCGNDYLQARSDLSGQTGTCNFGVLDGALSACANYTEKAMQAINTYATTATVKVVANLYYPGYDADNVLTGCTDAATGQKVNKQAKFLPYLAHSNWRTCHLAAQYGFKYPKAEFRRNWEDVFLTSIVMALTLVPALLFRRFRVIIPPEFQLVAALFFSAVPASKAGSDHRAAGVSRRPV